MDFYIYSPLCTPLKIFFEPFHAPFLPIYKTRYQSVFLTPNVMQTLKNWVILLGMTRNTYKKNTFNEDTLPSRIV